MCWSAIRAKPSLLKSGNKGELIDARKLAELLRNGALSPVYHDELSSLEVQRRTRSHTMLTEDATRIMSRVKAVFCAQAILYHGKSIYRPDRQESYLAQLPTEGVAAAGCAPLPRTRCCASPAPPCQT